MSTPRQKSELTPEKKAALAAVRAKYQREKPSLEDALSASGATQALPLGEVIFIHTVLAALKRERDRQGVSAATVAQRAGIDPGQLSRLESGKHPNPTLATVERIARALGKTVKWSLEDIDAPQARASYTSPPVPPPPSGESPRRSSRA
jgi:hypothetical protein